MDCWWSTTKGYVHMVSNGEFMCDGTKLATVWFQDGDAISINQESILEMEVVSIAGQMSRVPWVRVRKANGGTFYMNLSLMEGFELEGEGKDVQP